MKIKYDLITVLGPTACGKTRFAACLSEKIGGEIISADSRQVYKRMTLGTGKDFNDYIVNGNMVPYHLVDILEPGEKYNVFEFQQDFMRVLHGIKKRENIPILCGGTGLYIDAVTQGYKLFPVPRNEKLREELSTRSLVELTAMLLKYKKLHNKTDIDNKERAVRAIEIEEYYLSHPEHSLNYPSFNPIFIGIVFGRDIIRQRITQRLMDRLKMGMIEEVRNLLDEGIKPEDLIYYGLEYKFITLYLTGELTYDVMVKKLNTAIHQFAKRQMTWFRKMQREGTKIHWLDEESDMNEKLEEAIGLLGK